MGYSIWLDFSRSLCMAWMGIIFRVEVLIAFVLDLMHELCDVMSDLAWEALRASGPPLRVGKIVRTVSTNLTQASFGFQRFRYSGARGH